ncbi:chromate efflux transporter [Thalassospira alkalitolerans]|uniref:Chromate transporter n=1 Tax=Thalassospira alkalitolerans TaxID=1293890 RepID=A0A1Y2L6W6_9PROT|nr:chromate efflux transporter [Thalassospira alkalitolerans]OSQ44314.1 chromate transporter [Thalassospira alkalitolerans]
MADQNSSHDRQSPQPDLSLWQIFLIFLRLGLTSFGGPVAHISYFREEFVTRRQWLSDATYGDLVALCQFVPGPASSQVGMGIGMSLGGFGGAFVAWLGFTMPSAVVLAVLGLVFAAGNGGGLVATGPMIWGLKLVAVGVVAHALLGMARSLCPDMPRAILAITAAALMIAFDGVGMQAVVIVGGLIAGLLFLRRDAAMVEGRLAAGISPRGAIAALGVFAVLLIGLPVLAQITSSSTSSPFASLAPWLAVFDGFYRSGALVFGGGHVVLPLLQEAVVAPGWVDSDVFLAGYGATQAVPGPIFTFAAYLGAVMQNGVGGIVGGISGAIVALIAIFLPAFLLVIGLLPFWDRIRHVPKMRAGLAGINAAVVGLLAAVLYDPVWTGTIHDVTDLIIATIAFGVLQWRLMPVWALVLAGAGGGAILGLFGLAGTIG